MRREVSSGEFWTVAIDRGGTFTDAVGIRNDKRAVTTLKVLSSGGVRVRAESAGANRMKFHLQAGHSGYDFSGFSARCSVSGEKVGLLEERLGDSEYRVSGKGNKECKTVDLMSGEGAAVVAARVLTGTPLGETLPPCVFRLSTTKGTNALLQRKTARTVTLVTKGFRDIFLIRDQTRPHLFDLSARRVLPVSDVVIEVNERVDSRGRVLEDLELDGLIGRLEHWLKKGITAAAVCLLNSYSNPVHERRLGKLLRKVGFQFISLSSEISSRQGYLSRAETTLVNSSLMPVMEEMIGDVEGVIGSGSKLEIMTSAGGLLPRKRFQPCEGLVSGPAGGVRGAVSVARRVGVDKIITFDMGGTSTDVSRFEGRELYREEHSVADARVAVPSLRIQTVASGGGSVCWFDGEALRVGPESAGADPGPACYGTGGPLTLTDVNLLAGRLDPDRFGIPVDREKSKEALNKVLGTIKQETGRTARAGKILEGFIAIAEEKMAAAIRAISTADGIDLSEYTMVVYGGAGGLHACGVGERLGIKTLVVPKLAGVLSAYGVLVSAREEIVEWNCLEELNKGIENLDSRLGRLEREVLKGLAEGSEIVRRQALVRVRGQEDSITVEFRRPSEIAGKFTREFRRIFGFSPGRRTRELVSVRVIARENVKRDRNVRRVKKTLPFRRPLLLMDEQSSLWIPPGWSGEVMEDGTTILSQTGESRKKSSLHRTAELELFTRKFEAVVRDMGELLCRCAISTNIRERKDFSCALLDNRGNLVVNAPHVPVHLGSVGYCVREVLRGREIRPGETLVTNHPRYGGTHLPDLTMITPVDYKGSRVAYLVNRAHHAEMGGIRPGSFPTRARSLEEEGVVIPPTIVAENNRFNSGKIEGILKNAAYPSRQVEENLLDLQAAYAANRFGVDRMAELIRQQGLDKIERYLRLVQKRSGKISKQVLQGISLDRKKVVERLDDGARLCVSAKTERGKLLLDFEGTSGVLSYGLNAPPAITWSAIIYVMRLLVGVDIPLNEGLLKYVTVRLPVSLLNPDFSGDELPPVAGGNVETSQRLVDLLIKLFGISACSQGTMNNLVFGNERFSYYETIGGGAGAGPGFDGESCVHTHMTNTRITDVEVLEWRYPVRVRRFQKRRGSGGKGKYRGGDGIVRELEFLEPVSLSLVGQHRRESPFGREGGLAGSRGTQWLIERGGKRERLEGICDREIKAGGRLVIATPGGGGWGAG